MTCVRPYNKVYMNYLDALLLLSIALLSFVLFARLPLIGDCKSTTFNAYSTPLSQDMLEKDLWYNQI